ncbi:MAG: FadR/GntR family transcriptional regulator [Pelagimonas sp.]|uniref:FadR/GntR family transcriptional regulator n=1 Tax=Pelagimonas sp. TaxID=2073170 RepID=UPI003D6AEA79
MGIDGTQKGSDWLRRTLMTVTREGRQERASNHTNFVVDQIGLAIVAGEYPVDTMIPLDPDICEMFGVSRTVVREAKKTLIAKGMIQSRAKVGTRVHEPENWNMFDKDVLLWHAALKNPQQFYQELFDIRLIFEPAAAAKAAELSNAVDNTALSSYCDQMEAAASRTVFAVADYEFHKQVLRSSNNRFLLSLGDMVQTALFSLFMAEGSEAFLKNQAAVAQKHRKMADAISTGNSVDARRLMTEVIDESFARTLKRVQHAPAS